MKRRKFPLVESLTVVAIVFVLFNILWPVLSRPSSFRDTKIQPIQYHNTELQTALDDLFVIIQKQRGSSLDYARYFQWERSDIKKRRISIETHEVLQLREIFHRLEQAGQVKFDYLQRPYHPGDVGRFIIRDKRGR